MSGLYMALIRGYVIAMKKAKVSELKNRLSHYLRAVRAGDPVLVYDREHLIARIEPVRDPVAASADWTVHLEKTGVLRPPAQRLPANWLAKRPRGRADVLRALLDERASGR